MRTLVGGAKKVRRTERQHIGGSPGGRVPVWFVIPMTLVLVAIAIWVAAMILL